MSFLLDQYLVHRIKCAECGQHHRKPCVAGWRLFNDAAYVIARTPDIKRAKA